MKFEILQRKRWMLSDQTSTQPNSKLLVFTFFWGASMINFCFVFMQAVSLWRNKTWFFAPRSAAANSPTLLRVNSHFLMLAFRERSSLRPVYPFKSSWSCVCLHTRLKNALRDTRSHAQNKLCLLPTSNCLLNKAFSNYKWNWLLALLESDLWNWLLVLLGSDLCILILFFLFTCLPFKKKKKEKLCVGSPWRCHP